MHPRTAAVGLAIAGLLLTAAPAHAVAKPEPGSAAYELRDLQNIAAAYGRITGPGGQLRNPAYLPALIAQGNATSTAQLLAQAATPTHPELTTGALVPGWNVGNPLRAGWAGTRGQMQKVAFTDRYGALLHGTVYRPMPHARDPYSHRRLRGPFPGVVITEGSVQGSEGMYRWLAEDLAERGYVVLTYDVQGQGTSETLPHTSGSALPFCNVLSKPLAGEMTPCPGVPFQQLANFVVGTRDALSFFTSDPRRHYPNPRAAAAKVDAFNPYWRSWNRTPDRRTVTAGRTTRIAIIGHSLGAAAVSKVQGIDKRVEAVVALDKLTGPDSTGALDGAGNRPKVPALAVQSEYGFTVTPWQLSGGSSLVPGPSPQGPDPMRERRTGYDAWASRGLDTMLVVPRASTHLEYTDIPLVLPASRYGQDLASHYTQAWLDRYLKHRDNDQALTGTAFRYLEPVGHGRWSPVTLHRGSLLSFYYCSAWHFRDHGRWRVDGDVAQVGGCSG
ncbi:alpha/beta hydrolase family protein [Nocardioides terrisoli]|uniref:alpha/beta hydrolase n=1 Tax=Nocardioides terrisoli TaxID=3388267 RepID=UPI00287B91C3|nr:alpha/beta hydrolase [Nocardioides marmorisolisilvae]